MIDGLTTQLTTAIPQLDSAGFKATFFLTAIQGSSQSDVIGQTPEVVLGWHNAAKTDMNSPITRCSIPAR